MAFATLGFVLLAGCGKGKVEPPPKPLPSSTTPTGGGGAGGNAPPKNVVLAGRLEPGLVARFYHEPEGSEVLPLFLLRFGLLKWEKKQFMENLERFGLLDDPKSATNPEGLPVGMTVDVPRDVAFLGLKMTGFNCAACHVGELRAENQRIRIVGAPAKFDIKRFYRDFGRALNPFSESVSGAWQVYQEFQKTRGPAPGASALTAEKSTARSAVRALESFDPEKPATTFERRFAEELKKQFDLVTKEVEAPERPRALGVDAEAGKRTLRARDGARAVLLKEKATVSRDGAAVQELRDVELPPGIEAIAPQERSAALTDALSDFGAVVRLLVSRVRLAIRVGGPDDAVDPGPGRVDAFVTAKNVMFGSEDATNSPVSFPAIWGIDALEWLHWDGNTNSVMERNMGQAIGLGAVIDKSGKSTLLPRSIHELETWARKLDPPKWPFAIDGEKEKRGKALFDAHCAKCHDGPDAEKGIGATAPAELGTDRHRAENFASSVNGAPLHGELAKLLALVKKQAYADATPPVTTAQAAEFEADRTPVVWRAPGAYANRALHGVWSTAPYLHNGSVPTLAHLLNLVQGAPTFPVGHSAFDTKHVGLLIASEGPPMATFDTSKPGNSNAGHPYGKGLKAEEKWELIEYLKTR